MTKEIPDYIGQKFNSLTIISQFRSKEDGRTYFCCQCDCGKKRVVRVSPVINGKAKTCGAYECIRKQGNRFIQDHVGEKFGRLTVLSQKRNIKEKQWYALCRCECGNEVKKNLHRLLEGNIKTCGSDNCKKKFIYERLIKYVGQKHYNLTVLSLFKENNSWRFRCRCDCNRIINVKPTYLINGVTRNCNSSYCRFYLYRIIRGTQKKITRKNSKKIDIDDIINLTGRKFGRLTVIKQLPRKKSEDRKMGGREWLCQCACGKKKKVATGSLLLEHTRSCGCLLIEKSRECAKDRLLCKTAVDNSMVLANVVNLGYKKNGCKIGVRFGLVGKGEFAKWKWIAGVFFQGKARRYFYDSYEEALKKRLEMEKQIHWPFINKHRKLLPKDFDIKYWQNLNSDVKFNPRKFEKDKMTGKTP